MGKMMFTRRVGLYAALILATAFLYLGLSRIVLTDVVLTVFILLSMLSFYLGHTKTHKTNFYILSYIFAGLAVLTKGPLGIIIPFSTIALFFIIQKEWTLGRRFLLSWPGWSLFFIVTLPWYSFMSLKFGNFLHSFFFHENIQRYFITAEHVSNNHWYFYPAVILLGLFPWSNLLPFMFTKKKRSFSQPRLFLHIWFWFTLLLFTFAQSKLISYILPLFPALCLLFAKALVDGESRPKVRKKSSPAFLSSLLITLFILGVFVYSLIWIKESFPGLFPIALGIEIILAIAITWAPFLVANKKGKRAIIINVVSVSIVIILTFNYIMPRLEGSFSDKMLLSRIPKNKEVQKEILSSKMFVRGVYYYTNRPVVVIADNKQPFYTAHPLDILSTDSEIEKFFLSKKDIVCVVDGSDLERIDRLTKGKRENSLVYKNGERVVITSKPLY
jgi:4-amino-4-deoxy-L-arabinose transferase-like glycosyltransferase